MNDTSARLAETRGAAAAARAHTGEQKRRCLEALAAGVSDGLVERAKMIAHEQPDVTRRVGASGLAEMRADLRAAARDVAEELAGAMDEVDWPSAESPLGAPGNEVRSALWRFLRDGRTGRMAEPLRTRGFDVHDRGHGYPEGLLPQYIWDDTAMRPHFDRVGQAIRAEAAAQKNHAAAVRASDAADVDTLWGDD